MKTACFAAALALLAVALVPQASARKESVRRVAVAKHDDPATGVRLARLLGEIRGHRDETWRWEQVMQRPRTVYAASAETVRSVAYRQWVVKPLALPRGAREAHGAEPAAQGAVAVHPPLRGLLGRPERTVLRRPPDGSRVPADLRWGASAGKGHRRPLVASRADVGCRAGLQDTRFLALAEHGQILRIALAPQSGRVNSPEVMGSDP